MGYTVELEESDLLCRSESAALEAEAIIKNHGWIHPYHLQVSPVCRANPPGDANWSLEVEHFQGDHWQDHEAREVWLAIAPHLEDGSTLEFRGEEGYRWRVRWEGGRVFEEYVTEVIWAVNEEITAPEQKEQSPCPS